jgi:hypothetical protein
MKVKNHETTFELYNFAPGFSTPASIQIGSYNIQITDAHCSNLDRLPRNSFTRLAHDDELARTVIKGDYFPGEFVPTATVIRPSQVGPSGFVPGRPEVTSDYDLVLLLTFLTGRPVYLEADLEADPRRTYSGPIVGPSFFAEFPQVVWNDRSTLTKAGLSDALYCLTNATATRELIGKGSYLNAAFDTLVTTWAKQTNNTTYPDRSAIDRAIRKLVDWGDSFLLNRVRRAVLTRFPLAGVSSDVVDDIVARVRKASEGPSAIMKMTMYLQTKGLFPQAPTLAQSKRLKGLNTVRNAIAHSGTVRLDKQLGLAASERVAVASLIVTSEIIELGVAEHLGVHAYGLNKQMQNVLRFFETGEFRGQNVFTEDLDDYLERIASEWVVEGKMG